MARDYKNSGSRRRKPTGPLFSGWVGLSIGLTLGVALAASVHLHHTTRGDQPAVQPGPTTVEPATNGEPRRRPTFDFYRMLPSYEVVIPEQETAMPSSAEQPSVQRSGVYVLQAGSFRSAQDADRQRAQLALLGVESHIQTVTIDDTDTWHRVRVGPMSDLAELNNIRRRLSSNSVEALVIRVGD